MRVMIRSWVLAAVLSGSVAAAGCAAAPAAPHRSRTGYSAQISIVGDPGQVTWECAQLFDAQARHGMRSPHMHDTLESVVANLAPENSGFGPADTSLVPSGAGNAVERAALAELTHAAGDVGWYNADLVNACLRADKARG
jgi:hypothetical protein